MNKEIMWQLPETAPKTGEIILADMGWPWPCQACWNNAQNEWVYAVMQLNFVDGENDPYFENEYGKVPELKRWMPLPDLQK